MSRIWNVCFSEHRGASLIGTSSWPLYIDPVPTISMDMSPWILNLFTANISFCERWVRRHILIATRELPKVTSMPTRSAQHWEWFDSGRRSNVSSLDVLESSLSRASSHLALGLCGASQVNLEMSL